MKVLVVGYGSMGRRRIRLLSSIVKNPTFLCVDNNPERVNEIEKAGLKAFKSLTDAINEKPDLAFVCTSPGHHAEIISQLVLHKVPVFTELNLVSDKYDEILREANENNVVVFMSSTMLYNRQIQNIDRIVKTSEKPVTYIYHIGQYLQDWHPWESYKNFFIGRKETNGVREIYAIQLPWIINSFGKIDSVQSNRQRCTGLDIEFNDAIVANLHHVNGNIGVFVADTVSRKATTYLEVISENFHLTWHGHNDDLNVYDPVSKETKNVTAYENAEHQEGYADNIIENQYVDEIRDFLNAVYNHTEPKYSLEKDAYTLSVIDQIEGRA